MSPKGVMDHGGKETDSSDCEESLIHVTKDNPDDMSTVNINSNGRLIAMDSDSPALKIENKGTIITGCRRLGWSTAEMDVDFFVVSKMLSEWTGIPWTPELPPQSGDAEFKSERLVQCVTVACDVAIPSMKPLPDERPQPYWWNDEIAIARTECIRKRRRLTKLRGKSDMDAAAIALNDFRSARRDLKHLIRESKANGWNEMAQYVENDPTPKGSPIRSSSENFVGHPQ